MRHVVTANKRVFLGCVVILGENDTLSFWIRLRFFFSVEKSREISMIVIYETFIHSLFFSFGSRTLQGL